MYESGQRVHTSTYKSLLQRMRNYWIAVRLISLVTINDLRPVNALSTIQTQPAANRKPTPSVCPPAELLSREVWIH